MEASLISRQVYKKFDNPTRQTQRRSRQRCRNKLDRAKEPKEAPKESQVPAKRNVPGHNQARARSLTAYNPPHYAGQRRARDPSSNRHLESGIWMGATHELVALLRRIELPRCEAEGSWSICYV